MLNKKNKKKHFPMYSVKANNLWDKYENSIAKGSTLSNFEEKAHQKNGLAKTNIKLYKKKLKEYKNHSNLLESKALEQIEKERKLLKKK